VADPYLYPGTSVLKNKLGIMEESGLEAAEFNYVSLRLKELKVTPLSGSYDFKHLCDTHKYIFQDLYEWAGEPRIINITKDESINYAKHGDIKKEAAEVICKMENEPWEKLSLGQKAERFSKHFAALWKIHPFREGNTRAVTHFCCQYADKKGIAIDSSLFAKDKNSAAYLRDSLVAANTVFYGLGDKFSLKPLHLIVLDAIQQGQEQKKQEYRGEHSSGVYILPARY